MNRPLLAQAHSSHLGSLFFMLFSSVGFNGCRYHVSITGELHCPKDTPMLGTPLVVQWLRLHAPSARAPGFTPVHATCHN